MDLKLDYSDFVFDPGSHIYRKGDREIPSVTTVLQRLIKAELNGVPFYVDRLAKNILYADIVERAGTYGEAVHMGCHILARGEDLAWDKLHPSLIHPLREFQRFMVDYAVTVIIAELPLYSAKYWYAGTFDLLCLLRGFRGPCIVDYKSGDAKLAGPQTAAYARLAVENLQPRFPRPRGICRFTLTLPKDSSPILNADGGQYRLIPHRSNEDFQYFLARLVAHKIELKGD